MIKKPITFKLNEGLDARPIALLVQEANQYASTVYIEVENKKINAKSIMGMMSLQLGNGEELTVVADGEDEEDAIQGVENFLASTN
ncbi:MAG: HPr family phosphocarrier protein [Dorea sp.]|nr:HPr family phosphocarrier protein [Dorea sp.]